MSSQVLHHDCISVIVSRFTTFTENFVICCNQNQYFCTRYGSANVSSARSPCDFSSGRSRNFGLSESEYKHCVYPNPHFSQPWALKMIHEKNFCVSLCVQELCHPQDFFEFLQPFRYFGMARVSPFLIVVFNFIWV